LEILSAKLLAMTDETIRKPKRDRSPAYPGVDLAQAIDRANALYQAERKNVAPINAILHHWGYSPGSGRGLVTLAALKHFGLLLDEGSGERRQARLSPRALRIILDAHEDSPERRQAVREAALEPKIHRELWEKYEGDLPSDPTLRTYLSLERNFTDRAVRSFIPQFRRTVAFAELEADPGEIDVNEEEASPDDDDRGGASPIEPMEARNRTQDKAVRSVQLPLSGTSWVSVQGAFPLSESAWNQMIAMLEAMKPGLTTADDDEA
jgi:hypothetical protein